MSGIANAKASSSRPSSSLNDRARSISRSRAGQTSQKRTQSRAPPSIASTLQVSGPSRKVQTIPRKSRDGIDLRSSAKPLLDMSPLLHRHLRKRLSLHIQIGQTLLLPPSAANSAQLTTRHLRSTAGAVTAMTSRHGGHLPSVE